MRKRRRHGNHIEKGVRGSTPASARPTGVTGVTGTHCNQNESDRGARRRRCRNSEKDRKAKQLTDEIEEHLSKQRHKRQAAPIQESSQHAGTGTVPQRGAIIGRYIYDDNKKTYLPIDSVEARHLRISTTQSTVSELPYASTGPGREESKRKDSPYLSQVCTSGPRRQRLVSQWGAKLLLQSMAPQSLSHRLLPLLLSTTETVLDDGASCSRTFDVVRPYCANELPTLLSVSNGTLTVFRHCGTECMEARGIYYCSARFAQDRQQTSILGVARGLTDRARSIIRETVLDATASTSITLPVQVNDAIKLPLDGSVLVAANTDKTFHGKPWRLRFETPHEPGGCLDSLLHFPKSDALCMEAVAPTTVAFGHRSSQITLYDVRSRNATALNPVHCNGLFGSVAKALFNQQRPNQLLVRGSGGYCRLYDLRMGTDTNSLKNAAPSLIFELTTPESLISIPGNLTWRCKGVVTNPTNSTCIWPYVNETGLIQLGVWCLYSGAFIGARTLPSLSAQGHHGRWLELASTITPTWDWTSATAAATTTAPIVGTFGMWAKWWGYSSDADIYQITATGRIDS